MTTEKLKKKRKEKGPKLMACPLCQLRQGCGYAVRVTVWPSFGNRGSCFVRRDFIRSLIRRDCVNDCPAFPNQKTYPEEIPMGCSGLACSF